MIHYSPNKNTILNFVFDEFLFTNVLGSFIHLPTTSIKDKQDYATLANRLMRFRIKFTSFFVFTCYSLNNLLLRQKFLELLKPLDLVIRVDFGNPQFKLITFSSTMTTIARSFNFFG